MKGSGLDYAGLRVVLLTRVSTAKQAKKYSHDAQERKVRSITAGDPLREQRKRLLEELKAIQKQQAEYRQNLSTLMKEGKLDPGSREYMTAELQVLATEEEKYKKDLANEQELQEKYNGLLGPLAKFTTLSSQNAAESV